VNERSVSERTDQIKLELVCRRSQSQLTLADPKASLKDDRKPSLWCCELILFTITDTTMIRR